MDNRKNSLAQLWSFVFSASLIETHQNWISFYIQKVGTLFKVYYRLCHKVCICLWLLFIIIYIFIMVFIYFSPKYKCTGQIILFWAPVDICWYGVFGTYFSPMPLYIDIDITHFSAMKIFIILSHNSELNSLSLEIKFTVLKCALI